MKPQQIIQSIKRHGLYPCFHSKLQQNTTIYWLGSRPGKVGQGGLKFFQLWRHSQKILTPKPKIFFECKLQDLLSFLRFWPGLWHLWTRKIPVQNHDPAVFTRTAWINLGMKVLISFWMFTSLCISIGSPNKHKKTECVF